MRAVERPRWENLEAGGGRRLRVIQVVNSLERGGAERLTVDLARKLDPNQFDVRLMVVRDGPLRSVVEEAGLPLSKTGLDFDVRFPGIIARMAHLIRAVAPDVVHTHMLGADLVGRTAAFLCRVPVIVSTQHDLQPRPWILQAFKQRTSAWVDATVGCSETVSAYCRDVLRLPADRVSTIPNGVDLERFADVPSVWKEPVVLGALGRLTAVKGHATLIRAFAGVRERVPGCSLRIAGDGPERENLLATIRELGLGDSVQLVGCTEDVPGFLAGVNVLVQPSDSEGQPLAVLEALAAARPIVASDIPALAELLEGGGAGVLAPVAEPEGLRNAICSLIENPEYALALGRRARDRAREHYSLERVQKDYSNLYLRLIASVARSPEDESRDEP